MLHHEHTYGNRVIAPSLTLALDGEVQTVSWYSYFNVWETDTGGHSTDKDGTNTLSRNITHKPIDNVLQPRRHRSHSEPLLCLLSHQTHNIHVVYGHREIFISILLAIPTQLKKVLGFGAFDFYATHSFTYYKLSLQICLLYAEFGLLYPAHKQTLWAIAP
jgi:hypothetical protein